MKKSASVDYSKEIESKALELMSLVKKNQSCKPADQVDLTVSVLHDNEVGVMVCGTAHKLEDCFYRLIQQRPELYYVIDKALSRYAHKGMS